MFGYVECGHWSMFGLKRVIINKYYNTIHIKHYLIKTDFELKKHIRFMVVVGGIISKSFDSVANLPNLFF